MALPTSAARGCEKPSPPSAPVQENAFAAFDRWIEAWTNATNRESLLTEGLRLAGRRREVLAELIRSDPEQALHRTIPESTRVRLPEAIVAHLETPVCGRGNFEVLIPLPAPGERAEALRFVTLDGIRYRAFVYGRRAHLPSKLDVPLHGIAVGDLLALHESPLRVGEAESVLGARAAGASPAARQVAARIGAESRVFESLEKALELERKLIEQEDRPGPYAGAAQTQGTKAVAKSAWTEGAKNLLFLRVDFSDEPGAPIGDAAADTLMQDTANFFLENSNGKMTLSCTVTPVLRMPQTGAFYATTGGHSQLQTDARAAAKALGAAFDTKNFDFDAVATNGVFGWNGLGMLGAKGLWINNQITLAVLAHELGHNLGLEHANGWITDDRSVIGDTGYHGEYGDVFDMMGGQGTAQKHFNAFYKNKLGWLPTAQVTTVNSSGTYRIFAYDQSLGSAKGALKIDKDTRDYWVSFRQAITNIPSLMNGAEVHWSPWSKSNNGTHLLNMRLDPQTGTDDDRPLPIGMTFSDTQDGIHITPIAKGGTTPESLDVVVILGDFPNNFPPTLSLGASATSAAVGQSLDFTATASDPDGDPLAYYWEFGDQTYGPSNAGISKSWSAQGYYIVRCVASDMRGGQASAWVVVTVGSPVAVHQVTGHVYDQFSRPVEGVRVDPGFFSAARAPTDSSGQYISLYPFSSSVTPSASKPGYTIAPGFAVPLNVFTDLSGIDYDATLLVDVDDPPDAADDAYATGEDAPLTVAAAAGLLTNDQDLDGEAIRAELVTPPSTGEVVLHADGSFTYTPPADFNGVVTFGYRADDGTLHSLEATVTITVNAVNDEPLAVYSGAGVLYGQAGVAIDFTADGTDVDGTVAQLTWNFGDGTGDTTAAPGALVPHTFANGGAYLVTVYATDDLTLDGPALTLDVFVAGNPAGDALYLAKGGFRNDWKSPGKDTLKLSGRVNPFGLDFSAGGPGVMLSLNGVVLAMDTLTDKGTTSGAVPGLKGKLSAATGAFAFSLSGLTGLDTGLTEPPAGQTVKATQDQRIDLDLSGGGLPSSEAFGGDFRFAYTNKGGSSAKGAFSFKKNRSLSGVFLALKAKAAEAVDDGVSAGHALSISGALVGGGSAPALPQAGPPAVTITVGDPIDTNEQTVFALAGSQLKLTGSLLAPETTAWSYDPSGGAVAGLKKFSFSNAKHAFALSTDAVTLGLDSSVGGTLVSDQLLVRVEVYTELVPATPLTFETVIELQRKAPDSKSWKR
ncbi:MAG: PKD domain-containing protein [Planctomycetes bacterium]|nr:PKD domain-containing protein [Planctomycetota bacterium]